MGFSVANDPANTNRQWPLVAVVRFTFEDLVDGEGVVLSGLPGNAIVIGGAVHVLTAWDSGTSAVLDIGDADDDDRFTATAVDLETAARTALTLPNFQTPVPTPILGELTEEGTAATEGEAVLIIEYVIEGRGNEVQY